MEVGNMYETQAIGAQTLNRDLSCNNNNESSDNFGVDGFTCARGTAVQNFYAGQKIFVTGGTGFLGKVLIEKLLRSCPNVSTIYVLIRTKKGKTMDDRIKELLENPMYDRLREVSPKFRQKIVGISGDCSVPGLGLSSTDRELLLREVTIVFHGAATVRFDEEIKFALSINVRSTRDIMDLAHRMPNLKSLIHVSTAYANCPMPEIEETFYPHSSRYEDLVEMLDGMTDQEIEKRKFEILGKWPNTYTFTKALAEATVRERCKGLCMGIFRPAVVMSCANEPKPGWTDSFYGPSGATTAVATGILKSVYFGPNSRANLVPVDMTVNAIIVSAWDVANQPMRKDDDMLIYNYCSAPDYPITWVDFCEKTATLSREFPLKNAQRVIGVTYHDNKITGFIGRIFFHYLPASIVDFCRLCLGYQPVFLKTYKRVHTLLDVVQFFCINDWIYSTKNVNNMWRGLEAKDKKLFRFSLKDLDWDNYFINYMKGLRIYLMNDDMSSLEESKKWAKRIQWIEKLVKLAIVTIFLLIFWKYLSSIFL